MIEFKLNNKQTRTAEKKWKHDLYVRSCQAKRNKHRNEAIGKTRIIGKVNLGIPGVWDSLPQTFYVFESK